MNPLWTFSDPKIKTLDCTVRDGGLINDHKFSVDFVKAVYSTCVASRVDYMELGYKNSDKIFSPDQNGAWKFCRGTICALLSATIRRASSSRA